MSERRPQTLRHRNRRRARLSDDDTGSKAGAPLLEGVDVDVVAADGTPFIAGFGSLTALRLTGGGPDHEINDPAMMCCANLTGRVVHINTMAPCLRTIRSWASPPCHPTPGPTATVIRKSLGINPATGELWLAEHGPMGGDEINIVARGPQLRLAQCLLWPAIQCAPVARTARGQGGINRQGRHRAANLLLVSGCRALGADFYTGDQFPAWKGNVFLGSLGDSCLIRLVTRLQQDHRRRTSAAGSASSASADVRQGPDGAVYLLTDDGMRCA